MPATAVRGFTVHVSAAPEVPVPEVIAAVTAAVLVVIVFPNASWIVTFGWTVHATPPVPPAVCVVTASFAAGPTVMLNTALVALVSPVLERDERVPGADLVDREVLERRDARDGRLGDRARERAAAGVRADRDRRRSRCST